MRRFPLVVALTLGLAAPAHAADHLMTVNEVALTGGSQFVELLDPANEPFPSPPYKLVVYDGGGTELGEQTLKNALSDPNPVTSRPMLLAGGPVGGQSPDAPLTVTLPTGSGQACFTRGAGETPIHCLRWGTITAAKSPGITGAAPPDGQSLQFCAASAVAAAPTPKAANACGGPGGGGPGGGGPGGGGPLTGGTADRTRPLASTILSSQSLETVRRRGYRFRLRSSERGRVVAQFLRRGRVLGTLRTGLRAGVRRLLTLRFAPVASRSLSRLEAVTVTLRLRVFDAAGNLRTLVRVVRLR